MPRPVASRENGKKGGRPRGAKSAATLKREAVLQAYRQRVCRQAQRLLDAELTVAQGCTMLFKKPKASDRKSEPRKVEQVKDEATIRAYLDGDLDDDPDDYYFITTERPDTGTIRGMFDRTFDKPAQRTEITGEGGGPVQVIASSADERL